MSAVVRSTRRDFLKSTALGTAALAFPASSLFAAANADVARVAPKTLIIRGRMFTEGKIVDSGVRIEIPTAPCGTGAKRIATQSNV